MPIASIPLSPASSFVPLHRLPFHEVLNPETVTGGLAWLSLAVVFGIALGNVRIFGIKLGVAAVLFSALVFGQLGLAIDQHVLAYFSSFALVLFVYALGLQLGPGFVASLRSDGVRLNGLALAVVVLGALLTAGLVRVAHLPRAMAPGLYAGAFNVTPALAAGQEVLANIAPARGLDAAKAVAQTNLAYSATAPFGLVAPILTIVLFRVWFRANPGHELQHLREHERTRRPPRAIVDVEVLNPAVAGLTLRDQRFFQREGVRLGRRLRGTEQVVPTAATDIAVGDIFRAVGPPAAVDRLVALLGRVSAVNLADLGTPDAGAVHRRELVVTHKGVLGKQLRELDLLNRFGVGLVQVRRAGVDLPVSGATSLHFGDGVMAIGPEAGLAKVEAELGNSPDALNQTQLIPIFLGICLGVVAGSIPIAVPGLHTSVKIGLAGGPMLVAILLSRLGGTCRRRPTRSSATSASPCSWPAWGSSPATTSCSTWCTTAACRWWAGAWSCRWCRCCWWGPSPGWC
jgi:putative transport protein